MDIEVHLRWRLVFQRPMRSFLMIKTEVSAQSFSRVKSIDVIEKIDLLVFHRPPESFGENVSRRQRVMATAIQVRELTYPQLLALAAWISLKKMMKSQLKNLRTLKLVSNLGMNADAVEHLQNERSVISETDAGCTDRFTRLETGIEKNSSKLPETTFEWEPEMLLLLLLTIWS